MGTKVLFSGKKERRNYKELYLIFAAKRGINASFDDIL